MNKKLIISALFISSVIISGCQKQNEYVNTEYAYSQVDHLCMSYQYICFDNKYAYQVQDNMLSQTFYYHLYTIKSINTIQVDTSGGTIIIEDKETIYMGGDTYKLNTNIKTTSLIPERIKEKIYGTGNN